MDIIKSLADKLAINIAQVNASVALLDEGATVPFISRYRKEVTGGLSDTQLRDLEQQLNYLRELEERRETILKSIGEQEKLTPELKEAILAADNKASLEDLYLPYKPKRRTKAQIAREAGLEPLADQLLKNPEKNCDALATPFINPEKEIHDVKSALEGARQILMERFSENAELLGRLRDYVWKQGVLTSAVIKDKEELGNKFSDYFEFSEPLHKIPSHRALALFRGRSEDFIRISIELTDEQHDECVSEIAQAFDIAGAYRDQKTWLGETLHKAWKLKLLLSLELDAMTNLRQSAEEVAITVFANNLKHLLMAAPAGDKVTMGLDPGLRTGVKVVVVDGTGKLLIHTTIFPHVPREDWDGSIATLAKLCETFKVNLVSIGNGTASRETDKLVMELSKKHPHLKLSKLVVSEAGASVYSASELAAKEFPELDVTFRGAVSIARRLQDPLAELIKIDPKSIGVGQYQHDVNQVKLGRSLSAVLEDCVNAVGVDVNTASVPLLASVSGLNETIAKNIVEYRDQQGRFKNRKALTKVSGFGPKKFEQAAGFLRISDGDNPLDSSAVHPEAYPVVEKILKENNTTLKSLMGNSEVLRSLKAEKFTDDTFGLPTVTDIIAELEKPGRDPRPEFKTATFTEGVEKIDDLKPGMMLEGVVSNVANFGAFVDIGVHQDGLIHISQLSNTFVKDPNTVIKVGDIVTVKVLEVDKSRNRISLTRRLETVTSKETMQEKSPQRTSPKKTTPPPKAAPLADWQQKLAALKKD